MNNNPPFIRFITNDDHYNEVLSRVAGVRKSLWIGTADIKDLHVKAGSSTEPFLGVIARLLKRGIEVRLIHAKEPGPAFQEDFDRYPALRTSLERMLCPRVHFKMLIFDYETAYIGSANLTGAGIGMKSSTRRNFEAGILTNEPTLVEAAMEQFDSVWRGEHCPKCGRRQYCGDPVR
ncbi:MAG: phospholipase [Muribaculaceae bacterium]|nr:phospholipase [Muribaculaceae bacterium]